MKSFAAYLLATAANTLLAGVACISLVIVFEPVSATLAFASMVATAVIFGAVQIHLGTSKRFL